MPNEVGVRIVRVIDESGRVHIGFVFSDEAIGEGIELLHPVINMQTNEVTWKHSSRARHNIDFVEMGEDAEILRTEARKPFEQKVDMGVDLEGKPIELETFIKKEHKHKG